MTIESNINSLMASGEIAKAIESIKSENLHVIYCSMTGVEIGFLSDSEISHCLSVEANLNPMVLAEEMVEEFANRQALMSSGPAPSLRIYRSQNVLLSVLKADATGPNRLFGYLAGRLFFESILSERERDTFENLKSKLAFLVELQTNLSALGANWHKTLTPEDEAPVAASEKAMNVIEASFGIKAKIESQSKLAQRCLEKLIRIDGIFNLRAKIYSPVLMAKLIAFRDESNLDFSSLLAMLEELESDAIIRTDRSKRQSESNSQIVTLAVEAIGWQESRIASLADKIDTATANRQITVNSTAAHLISTLSTILAASRATAVISPKEKMKIESTISSLEREVQISGKRMAETAKIANRVNVESGRVIVKRGEAPLKNLLDIYESQGKALPEHLKAHAAKLERKIANSNKPVKKTPRKTGRPLSIRTHSALSDLMKSLTIPSMKADESKDS